jgi:hypothetical protein
LLDKLELNVDHSDFKGHLLVDVKKNHHIATIKNKRQLIKAIEKAARKVV